MTEKILETGIENFNWEELEKKPNDSNTNTFAKKNLY